MKINANFAERVLIHSAGMQWTPSPMKGVSRRLLDRVGGEVARATSVVRYDPGSHFSAHVHSGGEEFVVLEGVFQDEHGDYPAGSYIRNPPQSSHTPGSELGCVIFVKLWQFEPQDRRQVRMNFYDLESDLIDGVSSVALFKDNHETVTVCKLAAGATTILTTHGGAELFVLSGQLRAGDDALYTHSWLRLPDGDTAVTLVAAELGATVWIKQHHLLAVEKQLARLPGGE